MLCFVEEKGVDVFSDNVVVHGWSCSLLQGTESFELFCSIIILLLIDMFMSNIKQIYE